MNESIIWGVGLLLGIVVLSKTAKAWNLSRRRAKLVAEARRFMHRVKEVRALPVHSSDIILKRGEVAYYSAPSSLFETRAVRHYQSGHSGVRIAKGVYIGGSRGRSVSTQEWARIDDGTLTITNKRLVFNGRCADRTVQLGRIVSANSSLGEVEITVEGRQKSMVFEARNPLVLAAIIRICCHVVDPSDLSNTVLEIDFA